MNYCYGICGILKDWAVCVVDINYPVLADTQPSIIIIICIIKLKAVIKIVFQHGIINCNENIDPHWVHGFAALVLNSEFHSTIIPVIWIVRYKVTVHFHIERFLGRWHISHEGNDTGEHDHGYAQHKYGSDNLTDTCVFPD